MSTALKLISLLVLVLFVLGGRLPPNTFSPPAADTGWQVWSLAAAHGDGERCGDKDKDKNKDDEDDDKDEDNSGAYYKDRPMIRQY